MSFLHLSRKVLKIERRGTGLFQKREKFKFPMISPRFPLFSINFLDFCMYKKTMIVSLELTQNIIRGTCWFLELLCTRLLISVEITEISVKFIFTKISVKFINPKMTRKSLFSDQNLFFYWNFMKFIFTEISVKLKLTTYLVYILYFLLGTDCARSQ